MNNFVLFNPKTIEYFSLVIIDTDLIGQQDDLENGHLDSVMSKNINDAYLFCDCSEIKEINEKCFNNQYEIIQVNVKIKPKYDKAMENENER